MTELAGLRKQIKEWEHAFQKENGRVPLKEDIKLNSLVSGLYKQYHDLKRGPKLQPLRPKRTQIEVAIGNSDEDESDPESSGRYMAVDTLLGPTPQGNGKILSLFDTRMTPPESSPLKSKLKAVQVELPTNDGIFKTPTKPRIVNLGAQLKAAALETTASIINSSPTAAASLSPTKQTPRYMARTGFLSQAEPVTPSTLSISFQVSPSPLKPQRLFSFGTKRLADIFNEVQSIKESITPEDGEFEEKTEETVEETVAEQPKTKKAKTQKRTTRRWKIKPRNETEEAKDFSNTDVHEAIQSIEEEHQRQHERYLNSEDEESDREPQKPTQATGRMVKPVRMNYQRLKINDPRAKAFKRRMRR